MRLTYYHFPDEVPEDVLLSYGCSVILKNGREIYPDNIPEERRPLVDHINKTINCSVSTAKRLMKEFGGFGWTDHCDRDGSVFEVTEIQMKGNNSRFKYNHHL